jgi:hypothetical protein
MSSRLKTYSPRALVRVVATVAPVASTSITTAEAIPASTDCRMPSRLPSANTLPAIEALKKNTPGWMFLSAEFLRITSASVVPCTFRTRSAGSEFWYQNRSPSRSRVNWSTRIRVNVAPRLEPGRCVSARPPTQGSTWSIVP